MGKEFNPHIDYSIRFNGSENVTKVKISLFDLEEKGLMECLKEKLKGEVFIQSHEIVFRKIHLTHNKDFSRERSPKREKHYKSDFKKREYNDKNYRVFLDSMQELPASAPEYVDIDAENERRAIIRALHSIKVFDFPRGWENATVVSR